MPKSYTVLLTLALTFLAAAATLLDAYQILSFPPSLLMGLRWAAIGAMGVWIYQRHSLTAWIVFSMVVGTEIGLDFPAFSQHLNVFSKIFLRLIKTVIAPLLFGTLVAGIAGHSDLKQVGRMGWKSLLYFEIVTTLALFIGVVAINISGAGYGGGIKKPDSQSEPVTMAWDATELKVDTVKNTYQLQYEGNTLSAPAPKTKQKWDEVILHIFPENVAKMIYDGQVLQIVVFSILFGIALLLLGKGHHRQTMLNFAEGLAEVMFKFTGLIMYLAPFAVGSAIAYTVGHMGIGVLVNLIKLVATLYVALIAFMLLVLLPVALIFRINVVRFLKAIAEPVSLAFATTSSEAALPKAMDAMENFGVPRKVIAFVMPMGYSFNLDGTTLYLALASIFVAQAAGVPLTWGQQILMVLTLMLTSKGVAGVPRASLVILMGTAASFDLPEWPIYLIIGIDELMDMARTSVNVVGNCLASAVIARSEGELIDPPQEA
jgi:proton glutamate symport protein